MSTASPMTTIDVSATAPVPLARLAQVELRKAMDTRAGFWVTAGVLGLVSIVLLIYVLVAPDGSKNFGDMLTVSGAVLGYFLPIIVIMLVTSEQSQRNGLVTFTLEPRRSRVVVAKFVAGLGLALGVLALAVALSVVFTGIAAVLGDAPQWSVEGTLIFNSFLLANVIGVLTGFAIAMLVMNTPAGIVIYFAYTLVLPIAVGILSALNEGFDKIAPWIEFNTAQQPLFTGDYQPSGEEWAQFATAGLIWLVLPLVLGTLRLLRIEFK